MMKTKLMIAAAMVLLAACGSEKKEGEEGADSVKMKHMEVAIELKEAATEELTEQLPEREMNTESYAYINENPFQDAIKQPLSTFSIDVDNASYTNVRRMLKDGELPPVDAVRIEEFINYFTYDYKSPQDKSTPFAIHMEAGECPWNAGHKLVHIGLKGYTVATEDLPASNLVFLIDVSGSMENENKLPLVKQSMLSLVDALSEKDHVSIVVYAGAAGMVLPSTSCDDKLTIKTAIRNLEAGGSTAGGEGLALAYKLAEDNFSKTGNNRILIATDGDFNVGPSSDAEMARLIESKRDKGIYLTVLGFGIGNYKDSKMEIIADKGNGNYFYIDSEEEAERVLVGNLAGTLYTIAKDVKIQVEFNPEKVAQYRLIGYENRMLNEEDFEDDKKDAGEIGAGHTVTAVYEIVPGTKSQRNLKYQSSVSNNLAKNTNEWLTVKFRYKLPEENTSKEIQKTCSSITSNDELSDNFKLASSVAGFGMLLRNSKYTRDFTYAKLQKYLNDIENTDANVRELVKLVNTASELSMVAQESEKED